MRSSAPLMLLFCALHAWGAGCDQPPPYYATASPPYRIAALRIVTPLDYMHGVRAAVEQSLAAAGLHSGGVFHADTVAKAREQVRQKLNATAQSLALPLTINVVIASIENCQAGDEPRLDLVFQAFVSWFPLAFPRTFESGAPGPAFHFMPQGAYNSAIHLSGGLSAALPTRTGTLVVDALGSTSAQTLDLTAVQTLQNFEARTGLRYSNVPTAAGRNKQFTALSQWSITTAPLGTSDIVLRFGAALSGGHAQSQAAASPLGDFRTYAGLTWRAAHSAVRASYALELGETARAVRVDFARHIVDTAWDVRFFPAPYRPIEIESRFNAGWIHKPGAAPYSVRFFGGNRQENFLAGDSWQIAASPLIRSMPQNRAGPAGSFAAANLTIAVTTFHKPLLPAALRDNADFHSILESELNSGAKILKSYWVSRDPAAAHALLHAPAAVSAILDMRKLFDSVTDDSDRFSDCDLAVSIAGTYATDLAQGATQAKRFIPINALAGSDTGSIDGLAACLADFRGLLTPALADPLRARLVEVQTAVRADLARIDRPAAEARASRDMRFIRNTVHSMTGEMNLFSVSPVAIFDAARIAGARYAAGAGLRLTLVEMLRFTAGYAFGEGRGAAFVSLTIGR